MKIFWNRNFLACELAVGICISIVFALWVEVGHGGTITNRLFAGHRSAIYSTVVSLDGVLLGFIIATTTIILGFASGDRFTILRNSRHYPDLWRTLTSTIRFLGIATIVALAALLGSSEADASNILLLLCASTTLIAAIRVARSTWILEKTIKLITARSDGDHI
jgi:hypothetical protein